MSILIDIGLVATGLIAKYLIGENWVFSAVTTKGLENIINRGEEALKNSPQKDADEIIKVCNRIIKNILPLVKAEYKGDDYSAVYIEFLNAISRVKINNNLLVELDFDEKLLLQHIKNVALTQKSVRARISFSEKEDALYNDLLRFFCKEMVRVATILSDFEITVSQKQLKNQRKILSILLSIYEHPSRKEKEFEELYCRELSKQLDKLEMFGIRRADDVARQQSLTIAYTTLEVEQTVQDFSNTRISKYYSLKGGEKSAKSYWKNLSVDKLLQEGRRILIVGDPGSGKTTLLKWVAIQTSNKLRSTSNENASIPFFIRLRECIDTGLPDVESFHKQTVRMIGGKPDNWVHRILETGRGIVLIDGVDEMPAESRKNLLSALSQLISLYPLARYIITSRPSAVREDSWTEWKEWVSDEKFSRASMQPMSKAQIDIFINKWFTALDFSQSPIDPKVTHDVEGLKRLLKTRMNLFRLSTNPLLCAMICALYNERGETLPSERIQLYSECVEMLLQRRDEVRKIRMDDYPDLPYSKKITLVQDLAWWLMQNGYSDVDKDISERYLDQELIDMGIQNSTSSKDVGRFLLERTGLLREETIGKLSFTHRTFQEYLAAQSAVSHFLLSFLINQSGDDQWRETIILACGEARPRERGEILTSLIKLSKVAKKDEKKRNIALLALACLETCTTIEPAEVRQQVIDYAKKFFPPQDLSEAQSIARAGDLAIGLLAYNPKLEPKIKTYCINSLAQIGTSSALKALSGYASDLSPIVSKALIDARKYFNELEFTKKVLVKAKCLVFHGMKNISIIGQIESLMYLDIYDSQISNLTILQNHLDLEYLDIRQTNVRDLSPLAKLTKLEVLDIRGTKATNLRPLSRLKSLRKLILDSKTIYDISVLSNLPKVEIIRRGSMGHISSDDNW